jgi:predicted component of type VI protein secretion system
LVSRRHCLLDNQDGWLAVEDLGSSNGTIVNGNKISSRTIVRPGDSLEIGPIAFEIHYDAPVDNGTSPLKNRVPATASSSEDTSLTGQTIGRETATGLPKNSNNLLESDRLSDLADTHFLETPLGLDSVDASEGEEAVLRAFERAPEIDSEKLDDLSWLSDSE